MKENPHKLPDQPLARLCMHVAGTPCFAGHRAHVCKQGRTKEAMAEYEQKSETGFACLLFSLFLLRVTTDASSFFSPVFPFFFTLSDTPSHSPSPGGTLHADFPAQLETSPSPRG
jgi:hypothetical protein